MIIQAARLRDGSRRITHITEVIGMEGDVIITQDLILYDIKGEDANGRLIGKHVSTGIGRPHFWDRARYYNEEQRLASALEAMESGGLMREACSMFGIDSTIWLSSCSPAQRRRGRLCLSVQPHRDEKNAEKRLRRSSAPKPTAPWSRLRATGCRSRQAAQIGSGFAEGSRDKQKAQDATSRSRRSKVQIRQAGMTDHARAILSLFGCLRRRCDGRRLSSRRAAVILPGALSPARSACRAGSSSFRRRAASRRS